MSVPIILDSRDRAIRRAANLGFATQLLFATERKGFRIASLQAFLLPAIQLDQIAISFDSHGRPTAYVTWAFLTDDIAAEFAGERSRLLSLPDWNEGANLWIIDVVAPTGGGDKLLRSLARSRFAAFERVRAVRRTASGDVQRVVDIWRGSTRAAPPARNLS